MFKITKDFECDYGHRVHNQTLDKEYSLDECLVCRHLHGHRMKLSVTLSAYTLTDDMVTDFKHLNWLKQFIDDVVDHKFIIDMNDPMFKVITGRDTDEVGIVTWEDLVEFGSFELDPTTPLENEILESFVVVDFVPTSENMSKWFFEIVEAKMEQLNVIVDSVVFQETPKSKAEFRRSK